MRYQQKWAIVVLSGLFIGFVIGARWLVNGVRDSAVRQNLRSLQSLWLMYQDEHDGRVSNSIAELFQPLNRSPDWVLSEPVTGRRRTDRYRVVTTATTRPSDEREILFEYREPTRVCRVRLDGTTEWTSE